MERRQIKFHMKQMSIDCCCYHEVLTVGMLIEKLIALCAIAPGEMFEEVWWKYLQ